MGRLHRTTPDWPCVILNNLGLIRVLCSINKLELEYIRQSDMCLVYNLPARVSEAVLSKLSDIIISHSGQLHADVTLTLISSRLDNVLPIVVATAANNFNYW